MPLAPPKPNEPYGRTLLVATDSEEILAMTWHPGATCAPHDHGAAGGHVTLVRGSLTETAYHFDGHDLVPTATHTISAPAILTVAPHTIHAMTAHDDALTIHRYTPRIAHMRVYDPARRVTLVVRDDCGAWLPDDPTLIVATEPWQPLPSPEPSR